MLSCLIGVANTENISAYLHLLMGTVVVKVMTWFGQDLFDDFDVPKECNVEEL